MGDPFRKVQPGEPFAPSSEQWNAFVDAARAERDRQFARLAAQPSSFWNTAVVRVRNDSGADLPRWSVLALGDPLFHPDDSERAFLQGVVLKGVEPTASHFGKFGVLLEPAKDGRICKVQVSGVTPARLDIPAGAYGYGYGEPTHPGWCDVTPGQTGYLTIRAGGAAQLLWCEGIEGEQWAVVRLSNARGGRLGRTGTGGVTARSLSGNTLTPGTGDGHLYQRIGDDWILDEDTVHTFRNSQAQPIAGNVEVQVKPIDGEMFVDVEDC